MFLFLPLVIVMGVLTFGYWLFLNKSDSDTSSISEITGFIHQCAGIFLRQQYRIVFKILVLLSGLMFLGSFLGHFNHFFGLVIFTGGLWGGVIGYFGLKFSIAASAKVVEKIQSNPQLGARFLYVSSSVLVTLCISVLLADMGLWLVVLSWVFDHNFLGLSLPILKKISYFQTWEPDIVNAPIFIQLKYELMAVILMSYAIGASVQAMITRVVGGIFRVSTHMGAENAFINSTIPLPEDDIRNPGVFADMVGRNVSGVSGVLSGVIQLVSVALAITAYLGVYLFAELGVGIPLFVLPFIVLGIGFLSQIVAVWIVLLGSGRRDTAADGFANRVKRGFVVSVGVNVFGCAVLAMTQIVPISFVLAAFVGILGSTCVLVYMSFFTRCKGSSVNAMRRVEGLGSTILKGIELGFASSGVPLLCTVATLFLAYFVTNGAHSLVSGMYGVAICAVAAIGNSLFFQGIACAQPMASTGVGLARMLQDETAVETLSDWEATSSGAGTGTDYSLGMSLFLVMVTTVTAVLIVLKHWLHTLAGETGVQIGTTYFSNHPLTAYPHAIIVSETHIFDLATMLGISVMNPQLIMGLLLGIVTVIVIVFLCVRRVSVLSDSLARKIRTEFQENPDIASGVVLPRYGDTIQDATVFSLHAVIAPFLVTCLMVVFVCFAFGVSGAIGHVFGLLLGVVMINFPLGSSASFLKKARIQPSTETSMAQVSVLRILGNTFSAVPDCLQPILNTVMVFVLSLALLLTVFSLKIGHMLVL
jgi:K(+)-stimulated pyrophosphate-energized sodium pump